MTTINNLKATAASMNLSNDYVKSFGKLSAKSTWLAAIDNCSISSVYSTTSDVISLILPLSQSLHCGDAVSIMPVQDEQEGGLANSSVCSFISIVIVSLWVIVQAAVVVVATVGWVLWRLTPVVVEAVLDVVAPVDMSAYDQWRAMVKEAI
jgi:hypothetical protein